MKRLGKTFVTIMILTILLITNTIEAAALQSFTDIAEDHWAKKDIDKMSEKGIITGYPDATFRPSDNIDKVAAIVMIFRTLKTTDKLMGVDLNSLVDKHNMILNQYRVPNWGREAVAVALEKNIVDQNDVKKFFKADGTLEKATRTEVSIFLGKTLDIYLEQGLKDDIITFDFKDAEFIPSAAYPYVDLLIRHNIINGDENGNFNPIKPIGRAAAAKMFSRLYDILAGIVSEPVKTEPDTSDEDLEIKEGKIVQILESYNKIVISSTQGETSLYKIEDDTKIIIQNKISNISYLQKDEDVKLYIDKYGRLTKIEVRTNIKSLEATIFSILNMDEYYLVTVKDDDSDRKISYKADDDTFVLLNDKEVKIDKLSEGDKVSLSLSGEMIEEIIAESKTRTYEGILQSNIVFNQYPKLVIKTHTQKIYELEIDDDVDIEKNGRSRKLTDLYKGDIVVVTTKYDKVTEIEATSVESKSEDEGIITEIILGNENKITILNEDGDTRTYVVASDADIEIDDRDKTINDLKLDYKVELRMENDMVVDIDAEEVETNDSITGVITEIFDDYEAITVKVKDGSQTKFLSVLAEDAKIISTSGREKKFSYLDEDDEVFIYGSKDHKIFNFVADKIIILKEN